MAFNRTGKQTQIFNLPNVTINQTVGLDVLVFDSNPGQTLNEGDVIRLNYLTPITVNIETITSSTTYIVNTTLTAAQNLGSELLREVDFDYSADSTKYSDLDLANNVIFVPIETTLDLKFSREIRANTILGYTNDVTLQNSKRGKKGSVILTHIVNPNLGDQGLTNNENSLKALSKPLSLESTTLETNVDDDTLVEMLSVPTGSGTDFNFIPSANLSSNTTYYLNLSKVDLKDQNDIPIKYTLGDGFVTDNSRSFILSTEPYSGFEMIVRDGDIGSQETRGSIAVGDTIYINRSNYPFSGTVTSIATNKITYQLNLDAYQLNVAYTAGATTLISKANHKLLTGDSIEIFDVVFGVVEFGIYSVTKINDNLFSIPLDTSGSSDGYLNYYVNFKNTDPIYYLKNNKRISVIVSSTPQRNNIDIVNIVQNSLMNIVRDKTNAPISTSKYSRFIRKGRDDLSVSYVSVDDQNSIITDHNSNNSILTVNSSGQNIRLHVKANTYPTHNVHPFNTSAPKVTGTFPFDGTSFTAKLFVDSITRVGNIATVITNHPHNLNKNQNIKILDANEASYNKTTTITKILNSTSFQYDLGSINEASLPLLATGVIKLKVLDDTEYVDKFNCIQVFFSQSMNTDTISVANNSHLIYANGTIESFGQVYDKTDSTIKISYDGFNGLVNCTSIKANTGNSQFTIECDKILRGKSYKVRVDDSVADLGGTQMTYQYQTEDAILTGFRSIDSKTGQEVIYFGDLEPPTIGKISFSQIGSSGVAGKVLESNTFTEIESPDNLQDVSIDLDGESIYVRFSEGINTSSVSVNSQNTFPLGSIQLSCDDFNTVVQMDTVGFLSLSEDNDVVVLTPKANLSSNSNYKLKVFNTITDIARNPNKLATDNLSSIRVITLSTIPQVDSYYEPGEIIRGTRTIDVGSSLGIPTEGLTTGSEFIGRTSRGKGKILSVVTENEIIQSITYTEIKSDDGTIKSILNGEVCDISDSIRFLVGSATISPAATGTVVRFDETENKIIYREENPLYVFSENERIYGSTNDGIGQVSSPLVISNAGFTTTEVDLSADAKFYVLDEFDADDILSLTDNNITGVKVDSNLIVSFNQTINVDSISINTFNSDVEDSHNIILSYDYFFNNCIPLSSNYLRSNNDTTFEFKPLILTKSNAHLTQGKTLYVKVRDSVKTKGSTNLSFTKTFSNTGLVTSNANFQAVNAFVYTTSGAEISLGVITRTDTTPSDVTTTLTNRSSKINVTTPIVIEFNEEISETTNYSIVTTDGTTGLIEITSNSNFDADSQEVENVTFIKTGEFDNKLMIVPDDSLASLTRFYVRVLNNTGNENIEGKLLDQNTYFQSFTTE